MALTEEAFIPLTKHISVILNSTNIGVLSLSAQSSSNDAQKSHVCLIDSGSDDDAAKHILRIVESKFPGKETQCADGSKTYDGIDAILNTHSHADHCGGNAYLVKHTKCGVWATRGESTTIEVPKLESALIWGGCPIPELRTKFYQAQPSLVTRILEQNEKFALGIPGVSASDTDAPLSVEVIPLPGHYLDMCGYFVTDNDSGKKACFLGDAIYGRNIIKKYWIPYLYNETEFRESLEKISHIEADWYIPSHGDIITSIKELVELNTIAVLETEDMIVDILKTPHTAEEVLKIVADRNSIPLGYGQFVLIGSTLRSYLSCMYEAGRIKYEMTENRMMWMNA